MKRLGLRGMVLSRPRVTVERMNFVVRSAARRKMFGVGNDPGIDMTEVHFVVEEAPEGGYTAKAIGVDIFTEADDIETLRANVRDAVHCHFETGNVPSVIRLHFTREEVIAA